MPGGGDSQNFTRLTGAFTQPGVSSFVEFRNSLDSSLVTFGAEPPALGQARGVHSLGNVEVPHGTTIVATKFGGGVVMAGDRRATSGHLISQRDIEKVFASDDHSLIGIAGAAGIALELVRLFQVELEHYEKMEGAPLSLDGKASRLSALLRSNLAMAMHGLAVVPLFAGVEMSSASSGKSTEGRIYSYDITGGRYEERDFHAIGSGSSFARGSLKKLYDPASSESVAAATCIEALYDAADDDSATGGPDMTRRIFPIVTVVDVNGTRFLSDTEVGELVEQVVNRRYELPDGPRATLAGGTRS